MESHKNLKGTWTQALATFLIPLVLLLSVRWLLIEPFVIPSASMLPNLLIHDHVLVKKFAYGIRLPLSDHWILRWSQPKRGDIVVFRYPEDPKVFYIKRIIGVPGDSIQVQDGRVSLEGIPKKLQDEKVDSDGMHQFKEDHYRVQFRSQAAMTDSLVENFEVPQGSYFVMGDNRDYSADSRVWGFLSQDLLVGPAWVIWLSCEKTLPTLKFLCDPAQIRWERIFKKLDKVDSAS